MPERYPGRLTDIPGLAVGHVSDDAAWTGCTVVLCAEGAVAGGSVRGLAPGTRETALLRPGTLVERAHAVLLTGGSAFGLAAADGVMRYLAERNVGYDTGVARVPIVPGAVLFDLALGAADVRPDAAMGYAACLAADSGSTPELPTEGNIGAGTGATIGKIAGMAAATKGGLGTASLQVGDLIVAAVIAVNAFGDVIDPRAGRIVAGARGPAGFIDSAQALRAPAGSGEAGPRPAAASGPFAGNTVIGIVATNARLDVAQANELAAAAHDGLARVVRPAHTLYDGDTLFGLATGAADAPFVVVADLAAEVTARAIINAVWAARGAAGLPAARDLR